MAREQYTNKQLSASSIGVIAQANAIIAEYTAAGYRMTLRQLYYQFVSKNLIKNEQKSYKRLANIISEGRLAGLVDWNAIEDRGRVPGIPHTWDSIDDVLKAIKGTARSYTIDHWKNQPTYVELWVEKQALASVLEPLARQHQVTLMINKGYSSQSAMYESAMRFRAAMGTEGEVELFDPDFHDPDAKEDFDGTLHMESDRKGLLLYLGDHDPSGEDMVRDIRDRMRMFGVHSEMFEVQKVALTTEQVRKYKPPVNPAKFSDPRASNYVAIHGPRSWEVDALSPPILSRIITEAIVEAIDADALDETLDEEKSDRVRLEKKLEAIKL